MSTEAAKAPPQSFWSKTKTSSKGSFDWLWRQADKLGDPVNKLSNKLGSEAFWPTDLQRESEKAARILKSFCKDGFYDEELTKTAAGPTAKQRVVKKIPAEVIKNCKGLAIFTTMRTGLWFSGAGGSGIVVAKKEDGTWAGPIGIMLHTAGLGFMAGVDIYDCVLVLNTQNAVDAFSRWRATIGGELSVVAGPVGAGALLESEIHKRQAPIFTYMKSRGFYAGVQIDGTVIIERTDENERFWGQKLPAKDILLGKGQSRKIELQVLTETLKAAEGDPSARLSLMPTEPSPSDFDVVEPGYTFGVPDPEDDDPYGVRALEKQGLLIREANTKQIAPEEEFEFNPKPSSPAFRTSVDTTNRSVRSSWRESVMTRRDSNFSARSSRRYTTTDMSTQTDFPTHTVSAPPTQLLTQNEFAESPKEEDEDAYEARSEGAISPIVSRASGPPPALPPRERVAPIPEKEADEDRKSIYADASTEPVSSIAADAIPSVALDTEPGPAVMTDAKTPSDANSASKSEDVDEAEPMTVQHLQVQQASRPQMVKLSSGGPRLVQVAKRVPPKLPERNPGRNRGSVTPTESLHETSPARSDKTLSTIDNGHEEHERRRGSETSEDKASSLKSNPTSESTEGDKVDSLQLPGGFPPSVSPPEIPARSRSREQTPKADAKDSDDELTKEQTITAKQEEVAVESDETLRSPIENNSSLDAKKALLEQKLKGLKLDINNAKHEEKGAVGAEGKDVHDDSTTQEKQRRVSFDAPEEDELDDDFDEDDFSDAEIVTATAQVAAPSKAPVSLGPRVSMAQIRSGLHSDEERSPSPRGRSRSRDFEDFS